MVEALSDTFAESADADLRAVKISIDYPLTQQAYPSIWVDYDDKDSLTIAGIDHQEYLDNGDGTFAEVTRWKFSGEVSLTAAALSSLERDNLYDELVRIFAFGRLENPVPTFRDRIEVNDFLAINANFDELRPGGNAAAPGTPWGTEDEVIYEKTISFEVIGEFVSDPSSQTPLVALSAVLVQGYRDDQAPVQFPDEILSGPTTAWDPHNWH